jgi:hypothetical protein
MSVNGQEAQRIRDLSDATTLDVGLTLNNDMVYWIVGVRPSLPTQIPGLRHPCSPGYRHPGLAERQ